jgi:uncharacterized protein YhfF
VVVITASVKAAAMLENLIPNMIFEVYKHCCNNETSNILDYKKIVWTGKKQATCKELTEKQQEREEEKQAHKGY